MFVKINLMMYTKSMELDSLIQKMIEIELNKTSSIPWYLASYFLKLNPGVSLFHSNEGDSLTRELSYNTVTNEIDYILWNKNKYLDKGSLNHFPLATSTYRLLKTKQ